MLYQFDLNLFRSIHIGWHSPILNPVFFLLTWLGDGWTQTILIFGLLASRKARSLFIPLIVAEAVSGLLGAQVLKRLVPRDRPSNLPWAHAQEQLFGGNSFPSGHTTTSFAVAVTLILTLRGTRQAWVGWVALGLAALVGLSRIYRGVHWPSDVMAGALFGTFFASAIYLTLDHFGWLPQTKA